MRTRAVALASALCASLALSACGGTGSTNTTTTVLTSQPAAAIFPYYADGVRYVSATALVSAFATNVLKMAGPTTGSLHRRSSTSGYVDVVASGGGAPTTVNVTKVNGDNSWWVTGATSVDVTVTSPTAGSRVSSPLALAGSSTAFEAVLNVAIYADGSSTAISTTTVMGGSNGVIAPYSGSINFPATSARYGTLICYTRSAKDDVGSTVAAAAVRIRF